MDKIANYSAAEIREVTAFANENEELKDILKVIKRQAEQGYNICHIWHIDEDDVGYVVLKLRNLGYEVKMEESNEKGDLYKYIISW